MLLQEIKTQDENFPYDEFKKKGYNSHVFGQKSYNGVAIISKIKAIIEFSNVDNLYQVFDIVVHGSVSACIGSSELYRSTSCDSKCST